MSMYGYLKITDNRHKDEKKAYEIAKGGFFMIGNDVVRRIDVPECWTGDMVGADGIPCILQKTGTLCEVKKDAWVTPIPDDQLELVINDQLELVIKEQIPSE